MSDSKTIWVYSQYSDIKGMGEFVSWKPDNIPQAEAYIAKTDHDQIMSERDELWKRATKFVMPGEMDTGESIEHYIKTLERTIATQSRKLDLARVLYHAAIKMIDRYSKEKFPLNQTHTVEDVMDRYDQELAAVEKGDKP